MEWRPIIPMSNDDELCRLVFGNSNVSRSVDDVVMSNDDGRKELGLENGNFIGYFQQSPLGNSSSPVDLKQISGSSSSIMMRSYGEACPDKEQFGVVGAACPLSGFSLPIKDYIKHGELVESYPHFDHLGAQPFPVSNMKLVKYNDEYPQQGSTWVSKIADKVYNMRFRNPRPSHEGLSQYGHHGAVCSVGQQKFYNEVKVETSAKLPQLSLNQLQRFPQQSLCNAQAAELPSNVWSAKKILAVYLKYKSEPIYVFEGQQGFVNRLHSRICNGRNCQCAKFRVLLSHFDHCHNCPICKPVHKNTRPGININTGLEKPKVNLTEHHRPTDINSEGVEPTHKRIKIDNAVLNDDWSLGDIVRPYLQQSVGGPLDGMEVSMNTNNELLRSRESPTAHESRKDTVDFGGSKSVEFGKTDDRCVGVPKSSECPTTLLTLNKESASNKGYAGKSIPTTNVFDNKEEETGDAFWHSQELNLVDKQHKMGADSTSKIKSDLTSSCWSLNSDDISVVSVKLCFAEGEKSKLISESGNGGIDANCESSKSTSDYQSRSELEGLNELGVSAIDSFSTEQIREHLYSLNPSLNLSVAKELNGNASDHTVAEGTCQLCAGSRLTFAAPLMYCTLCVKRIKHMSTYYSTLDEMGPKICFCKICFQKCLPNFSVRGLFFSKANLIKCKNLEENEEEGWVQCDKCECWQHQICGLYNSIRDLEGKGRYICPLCRLIEMKANEHVCTPPAFGARDLPRTMLSDHIEQRLFSSLERERKQRAHLEGKSPEEVPGAEDLTVRVVLAVNKQLKVKQEFLDILHGEAYPTEFPYKSKVILLFQKMEGVDVCLFAMYVQEYGSECGHPNKRSVYISYLDSVKHFRPEIRSVAGMALRTFVYHEILIGYLDYCKQRGYTTCYIWACPPLKGEDYILHCHPETQKRPLSAKLLQWYKNMLKKAVEDNVVVECTNLYDDFFVPSEACNSKITAARLPCFEGDYWSSAMEDTLQTIEKQNGGESDKKMKNMKRTLKSMGYTDHPVDAIKDVLVMQKLGDKIHPLKEGFIVARLHFTCTKCHETLLSGSRWSCKQCRNFHLCSRCIEFKRDEQASHTTIYGGKHLLSLIPMNVNDVAADTDDNDVLLDNEIMENRQSFLSFCEKNHYQFDTLRRAKSSSVMILYQLHKTTTSTVRTKSSCTTKSMQTEQQRALQVKAMLDLLKHANHCEVTRDNPCSYSNCLNLKKVFHHSSKCEIRASGGCINCKKIWSFLCLHSRNCTDSSCSIPRCMDIKEMLATQSAVQRNAAVQ